MLRTSRIWFWGSGLAVAAFAFFRSADLTGTYPVLVFSLVLGVMLLALSALDIHSGRLPNSLTLLLLGLGLSTIWIVDSGALLDHILGSAIGFVGFFLVSAVHHKLRGYDGLGGGDAKLLAAIGTWVGWQGLPTVILCAAITALLYAIVVERHASGSARIAFGPHLALAGWLVWVAGPLVPY